VVAIYFVATAAVAAGAAQCSTIYSSALELTDCICGWSVFGHHTFIAVNIILSKSCCTIFIFFVTACIRFIFCAVVTFITVY